VEVARANGELSSGGGVILRGKKRKIAVGLSTPFA